MLKSVAVILSMKTGRSKKGYHGTEKKRLSILQITKDENDEVHKKEEKI